MSANQIRQTRAGLEAIVPGHRAAWFKFGADEEIADLIKRSAILQGETHQVGHHVVEPDQFRGTVSPFRTKKDFGWLFVGMDGEVKGALTSDLHFVRFVVAAGCGFVYFLLACAAICTRK